MFPSILLFFIIFSSITNPNDDFKHELSSNETTNSFSSIKASSSGSPNSDELTPSIGSELGNDEASSSSTATPENISPESDINQLGQKNFGAISRDRSRNPTWATYTTSK